MFQIKLVRDLGNQEYFTSRIVNKIVFIVTEKKNVCSISGINFSINYNRTKGFKKENNNSTGRVAVTKIILCDRPPDHSQGKSFFELRRFES